MNVSCIHSWLSFVCSARTLSNGCKSRVSPNSGNYIAKGKMRLLGIPTVVDRLVQQAILFSSYSIISRNLIPKNF